MYICILLLSIIGYLLFVYGDETFDVHIEQGVVRGHKHATRDIYEFHGIPYATAPTGRNKFKGPLPPPNFEGIFDAVDRMIKCPQDGSFHTEDCLTINVFVPRHSASLRPVVVYIHGGAFALGWGNMLLPYNLVEKNIIAVTFNYRLGAHGFLCLNTEKAPGNAGLKDQLKALLWLKKCIKAFGGNPEDITLAGYSSGASSAEILMLSPAANGLVHKVILDSASALTSMAVNPNSLKFAHRIALQNGASNVKNVTDLEEFYLSLSYKDLTSLVPPLDLSSLFCPCIENNIHDNEDTILTELPYKILTEGNYSKLPLLLGYTNAEGLFLYDSRDQLMSQMNENFRDSLPPNFSFYAATDAERTIELIRSFYFDVDIITKDDIRNFTDYYTDSLFSYWVVESAKQNALNSVPVYLYEFTYMTTEEKLIGTGLGADHCAQTMIILESDSEPANYSQDDLIVQTRTVNMWANFIKYGRPVPQSSSGYWQPLDPNLMNYLVIDFNVEKNNFPEPTRMELWDKVWFGKGEPDAANRLYFFKHLLLINFTLLLFTRLFVFLTVL